MQVKLPFIEQIFDLGSESIVYFLQLVFDALSTPSEVLVCVEHLESVVNLSVALVVRFLEFGVDLLPGIDEFENGVVCFVMFEFG
jgi:hypothetical protein